MKVRIDVTLNVSDDDRRNLNVHMGRAKGMATREEVKRHLRAIVRDALSDLQDASELNEEGVER